MSSNSLDKIDHIVMLMLENRSFDHMLGFLYADENNVSPLGHSFEGLTGDESNPDADGKPVKVFKITEDHALPYYMPGADPGEGFYNTNDQLFGDIHPKPDEAPDNRGFIKNYAYTLDWQTKSKGSWPIIEGTKATDIMGMYTPEMLPVLSTLAKEYAVCDHWFSSAPTETLPNRAFVVMGTSQGILDDKNKLYTAETVFNRLEDKGFSWSIYGYNAPPLSRASYSAITYSPNARFGLFSDFEEAVKNKTLANFVYLEPQWEKGGNSQHPNYNVANGEVLIKEVYETLRSSELWEKTLLVITYDEHGGCYDHVAPPSNAVPPDDSYGEYGFDFKRFGVRVPSVIVSPYIEAGTVFRVPDGSMPLDHTSILKVIEERFGLEPLTERDKHAPGFGDVLSLSAARKDDPLAKVDPPVAAKSPVFQKEPDHLQELYADTMNQLPLEAKTKTGDRERTPEFKTGDEAMKYGEERYRKHFEES